MCVTSAVREDSYENRYCIHCFDNEGVKAWFRANGESGHCTFCRNRGLLRLTATVEVFCDFFLQCISLEYSTPDDDGMSYCSAEGGWLGTTFESNDLIDYAGLETDDETRITPIVEYLDSLSWLWCEREHRELSEDERLRLNWQSFCEIVRHRTRFVFYRSIKEGQTEDRGYEYNVNTILYDIGRIVYENDLIITLPVNTEFFRVRIPRTNERLIELSQLCGPEPSKAIYSNRMSPAGISMFYAAFEIETAQNEVIDPGKESLRWTVAKFRTRKEMQIVDFTKLHKVPELLSLDSLSISFQAKTRQELMFLNEFAQNLAKPIAKDGREHIDYVPTQVVTEYFRFLYQTDIEKSHNIMGIAYQSAVNPVGRSIVLFLDPLSCAYSSHNTAEWLGLISAVEFSCGGE